MYAARSFPRATNFCTPSSPKSSSSSSSQYLSSSHNLLKVARPANKENFLTRHSKRKEKKRKKMKEFSDKNRCSCTPGKDFRILYSYRYGKYSTPDFPLLPADGSAVVTATILTLLCYLCVQIDMCGQSTHTARLWANRIVRELL